MARHPTTVIFHMGRSGSTVFGDLLNQNPNIRADTEIYAITFRRLRESQPDAEATLFTQERHCKMTLRLDPKSSYLFEVKFFSALDMALFSGGLEEYIRFMCAHSMSQAIVIERSNTLRRLVSTLIAVKRGAYQLRSHEQIIIPRVSINCAAVRLGRDFPLCQLLDKIEAEYKKLYSLLDAAMVPTLRLNYERHIEPDPLVAYNKACEFLCQPTHTVATRYARINTKPLKEILKNFDEVCATLVGTRHMWMTGE